VTGPLDLVRRFELETSMPAREVDRRALGVPGTDEDRASADPSTLVIAIDGPSGSGKSTVARGVATALGLRYLDTGATYRALTWWVLEQGVDPLDPGSVAAAAAALPLRISVDPGHPWVEVAGRDVTGPIRDAAVTSAVSTVSAIAQVRRTMVILQRELIGAGGIVVEGRDIGTTVCPQAPVKIFLTASADERATRRSQQAAGLTTTADGEVEIARVRADLQRRDTFDATRAASPLAQPPDAVLLDSTTLDVDAVIARVLAAVEQRTGLRPTPLTVGAPSGTASTPASVVSGSDTAGRGGSVRQ
jgi:cytidylate kinase